MADTLSLDTAVQFAINRGASVRLVGDDQQLAAIGASGVLRDITHTHGALHLTELHRFTHPAEAAASLALREGDPTALNFYLRHGRIHVGDIAKTTEDAFTAWVSDQASGLDAIMLAPTRELVADLNRRARDHRLGNVPAGREVHLADGNQATVAELDQVHHYLPGLTTEPAWPIVRAHVLNLAAETGEHALRHLQTAAAGRDLSSAGDMAAVLYWRLPALTLVDPRPLPWLPGIPPTLHDHPVWGPTWRSDPN